MPTKMTLFFNLYQAGFSETFYHSNDDPQSLAQAVPNELYQLAAKFRHNSVLLKAVRFSRVQQPNEAGTGRLSFLHRPYPKAQGTRTTIADPGPEPASTTGVYMLQATNGARRRIWIRGLADIDVRRDAFGNDLESGTLLQMRNEYFLALFNAGFQIRWVQRPPIGGLTWQKIKTVTNLTNSNPNRSYIYPGVVVAGWIPGTQLSFAGISGNLPHFPRTATIIQILVEGGLTYYEIVYALPGGIAVSPAKLQATTLKFTQSTISLWAFERFGAHKTGRPFGSLAGKKRAVSLSR